MHQTLYKLSIRSLTLLLMLLLAHPSFGAQLYRYKDEQGNYVLNHTIPPKFVSKGYEVLNSQGRVIERVAPALTPEQIALRDAEREQERLREIERQKQAARDAELKQLYSHPDDAVRVLERKVNDIIGLMQVKKGHIKSTKNKILEEEAKAASRQRRGLNIEDSTLEKIAKLKSEITNSEQDIKDLLVEQEKVKQDFSTKIQRLEVITGLKVTKPKQTEKNEEQTAEEKAEEKTISPAESSN